MKIIGRSKALYGTWFLIPTYNIMFDCGDGAGSSLGIHTADAQSVFITHTHLDHISGLPTLMRFQKRVLKREPNRQIAKVFCHKKHLDKMLPTQEYIKSFGLTMPIQPIAIGEDVQIGRNVFVRSFEVDHQASYYRGKFMALGYHIIEKRKRLPELLEKKRQALIKKHGEKDGNQAFGKIMIDTKKEKGADAISEQYEVKLLTYCGDSRPVDVNEIMETQILMHEASFLSKKEIDGAHSAVGEVLDLVKKAKVGALVLYHISERYKREQPSYKQDIIAMAKKKKLTMPVHVIGVDEFFRKEVKPKI